MNNETIFIKIQETINKNKNPDEFEKYIGKINSDDLNILSENLLLIFENNPEYDFGMPGSIVHILESVCKGFYENKLIESIKRKPCIHTVWMAHRLYNLNNNESEKYLNLIKSVKENVKANIEVKDFIKNILDIE